MKQKVLILCTGNSCRSQMAEGVLRHYASARYEVFSAGTRPSSVNPVAIRVMKEIGMDISKHESKPMTLFLGQEFDHVITVCGNAQESCPAFPGDCRRYHWPFPDPPHSREVTETVVEEFRKVRDLIHEKFKTIAAEGFPQ
ncbi:MAG: arsenate reductase ArsC [Candidatus Omnitrophica bacterium]|nr:arsenate reductase ArsC [Candidatus Omnitrophota bacterium]